MTTTDRLRKDIDRGRSGDKVGVVDPAAAPLGTDEEAAGTPVPAEAVAQAHHQEVLTSAATSRRSRRDHSVAIYVALISAVCAAILGSIWLVR
jgi:hypothetical protein